MVQCERQWCGRLLPTLRGARRMDTKIEAGNVRLKRAYVPPAAEDGTRILVDRLWPRGVSKKAAGLDEWLKAIAPSPELRRWFGHDPSRWEEFRRRYTDEVHGNTGLLEDLRARAKQGRITLVFAARDEAHNEAAVLRDLILEVSSGNESSAMHAHHSRRYGGRVDRQR
jgi:uncharacterized protein YeaO (DUF488 family)